MASAYLQQQHVPILICHKDVNHCRAPAVANWHSDTLFYASYLLLLFNSYVVDGTFCQAALEGRIYIKEQLPKYFSGSVQLG